MTERKVRIGGVMRCCTSTLYDMPELKEEEGARLQCKHCDNALVFRKGAWEWEGAEELRQKWPGWNNTYKPKS